MNQSGERLKIEKMGLIVAAKAEDADVEEKDLSVTRVRRTKVVEEVSISLFLIGDSKLDTDLY